MKKKKLIISSVIGLFLAGAIVYNLLSKNTDNSVSIETTVVEVGNVNTAITATGTIEAIKTVDVGTQLSGVIEHIYIDYNDHVKKGQLIAEIDKTSLNASKAEAIANLDLAQAEFEYQKANYMRNKELYEKEILSDADFEAIFYDYQRAAAGVKTANAQLQKVEINLGYASIYAPINGIVLSRSVDEGQTVAASFNTPTLFSIANDLTKMQVEADIDEADIGQVKVGQNTIFTVDAYPENEYMGTVTQIRLEPQISSNVVTYTVIIEAPNPNLELMPGMTASVSILTHEANDVLIIPSKALRYSPDPTLLEAYQPAPDKSKMPPQNMGEQATQTDSLDVIWVKRNGEIKPAQVKTGLNDGVNVAVLEGLNEGDEVLLSMILADNTKTSANNSTGQTSPFMPQRPGQNNPKK